MKLEVSSTERTERGLIMIQIDGLSRIELEKAIDQGRMPFLKRLLNREDYQLHDLYTGLPSTTPAVQGELFYGVTTAVPAFAYFDRVDDRVRKMYEPSSASKVERTLAEQGSALYGKESSVYCDIYTGGAGEGHFCPAAISFHGLLKSANPIALVFLAVAHIDSLVRLVLLTMVETGLALIDFCRGTTAGQNIIDEMKFVFTRVGVCIGLRELISIGARIDIARGLCSIHLNLIGYDEQAHRRGPSSTFARWTLKGIDRVIARIWRASLSARTRDYDIWIYSDHGQEDVISYPAVHGVGVDRAVESVIQKFADVRLSKWAAFGSSHIAGRGLIAGIGRNHNSEIKKTLFDPPGSAAGSDADLHVLAVGPVGGIYCDCIDSESQWSSIAQALISDANLPMVLRPTQDSVVRVWTEKGTFVLPDQAAEVLGSEHPFLKEAAQDLVQLCQHSDAGDLVFSGWRADGRPYSFGSENGAHAGPGYLETHAFALVPSDTLLGNTDKNYLRPGSLRRAAQKILRQEPASSITVPARSRRATDRFRLMTYNVHTCTGMDRVISPQRVARVIARYRPDIVCLQELDVDHPRTGCIDQVREIARSLQMEAHFHASLHIEQGRFGNAVLTSLPMELKKAQGLPSHPSRTDLDPRGAIWVSVEIDGQQVQIINTHLGLNSQERMQQITALTGDQWLGSPDCDRPRILCGDLNATAGSGTGRHLARFLQDAQTKIDQHRPENTFFGRLPVTRIDHVFVDSEFTVESSSVAKCSLSRVASDHLPLVVELKLPD